MPIQRLPVINSLKEVPILNKSEDLIDDEFFEKKVNTSLETSHK